MDLFTSMIRKCRRRLLLLVVGFLLFELVSGHRINSDYDSNELSQQCGKVSRADYRCGYVHSRRQSSDEELEANDEDDDSDQFISLNPNSPAGSWRCKRQMSLAFLANPTNSCSIDCLTTLTSSYDESSGRMTVTNQTNGSQNESTIYCARARNSCGATIPVYLYSLENTGSQFVGETDDLRGKRCKKGTQPLCFAWPFNEDKDNKSRNPTNQMYPRTSIRRRRQVTDDYSSTTVASSTTGQSSTTSVPTTSTGTTTVGTSVASSTTGQSSTTSVSTTTTGTTTVGTSTVLSSTVSTTGEITTVPTTTVVTTALTTLPTTASHLFDQSFYKQINSNFNNHINKQINSNFNEHIKAKLIKNQLNSVYKTLNNKNQLNFIYTGFVNAKKLFYKVFKFFSKVFFFDIHTKFYAK
ncbi:hypothetical protein M3Y97_00098800 [Aphelenchoides bicaudatus]|nr:hypothetical protein M3Y97_00098800 [Aphelenchoides bicaudatus]